MRHEKLPNQDSLERPYIVHNLLEYLFFFCLFILFTLDSPPCRLFGPLWMYVTCFYIGAAFVSLVGERGRRRRNRIMRIRRQNWNRSLRRLRKLPPAGIDITYYNTNRLEMGCTPVTVPSSYVHKMIMECVTTSVWNRCHDLSARPSTSLTKCPGLHHSVGYRRNIRCVTVGNGFLYNWNCICALSYKI